MSSSSPSLLWLTFVGTIWLQAINGASSDFPIYSSQLKHLFSISQIQLNNLAFASDAGKLFGWLSGVAAAFLPLRLVLFVGAIFSFIGYGIQFLFLANKISHLSYLQVFFLTSLAGNGVCWINTVCYLICIKSFTFESSIAVGISTSYVGLSAKIYTAMADGIFHSDNEHNAKAYVLLNAVCPLLFASIVSPFLRVVDDVKDRRSNDGFVMMFVITLATGTCSVLGSVGSASSGVWSKEHLISLGVLMIAPIFMPIVIKLRERIDRKKAIRVHDVIDESMVVGEVKGGGDGGGEVVKEIGFFLMIKKFDFWLYFFSYMFGATIGMVFLNNLGQITESRGLSHASSLVSLSSSFGFFGRLMPSFLDYYVGKKGYMISRPGFMATMMGPIAASFFLLLNSSNFILYVCTAIIGACSGSITSIAVSATSDLFGAQNFALNHNIVVANIPIGSLIFGYLAALLYQKEGGANTCYGADCYEKTFIIWGSVCSLGTFLCAVLYVRNRTFCSTEAGREGNTDENMTNCSC